MVIYFLIQNTGHAGNTEIAQALASVDENHQFSSRKQHINLAFTQADLITNGINLKNVGKYRGNLNLQSYITHIYVVIYFEKKA